MRMAAIGRLAAVAWVLFGVAGVSWGQVSYDEAMRRLRERQEQRLREKQAQEQSGGATTTTAPVTAPASEAGTQPSTQASGTGSKGRWTWGEPPAAPREFRGIWVSSVGNGVWPSKAGLSTDEQRAEMNGILDKCAALRANAVVFQVRPCADALYPSQLEPWSEYMTGTQGKAPEPAWDPLQEWIDGAHKRGMELHAWFNPYRVKHAQSKSPHIDELSIAKRNPEVVKSYGGYLWMDPGEAVAAQHTLAVIADIVKRYDVDGVHTDDYYYPYQVRKDDKIVDFPDDASWQRYQQSGGKLSRDDWRRDNVNQLVEQIYKTVKEIKPWVKVGYAPFGIWKSGVPKGTSGLSQYDALYADAKLWLNKGWLDYMSPQLYWKIGGPQDYVALYNWWVSENTQNRHVWPGLSVSRHPVEVVEKQVALTRQSKGTSAGVIHWSANSVLKRPELYEALRKGLYAQGALVPASEWMGKGKPAAPEVAARKGDKGELVVEIKAGGDEPVSAYGVWVRYPRGGWTFVVAPGGATSSVSVEPKEAGDRAVAAVVTAVDRAGNESERVKAVVK